MSARSLAIPCVVVFESRRRVVERTLATAVVGRSGTAVWTVYTNNTTIDSAIRNEAFRIRKAAD